MKEYINSDICSACGGVCCTQSAGVYAPEDFKREITTEFILGLMESKKIGIDWIDGIISYRDEEGLWALDKTYYIRPKHKFEPIINNSIGGVCTHWTLEKGCELSGEKRPYQCITLIPNYFKEKDAEKLRKFDGIECKSNPDDKADLESMAKRWIPYQKQIYSAIKIFRENDNVKVAEKNQFERSEYMVNVTKANANRMLRLMEGK